MHKMPTGDGEHLAGLEMALYFLRWVYNLLGGHVPVGRGPDNPYIVLAISK